jgi:hypothetical protein
MAKVIQLRGQTPGGWSKERWVWMKAVAADGRLLPMARLVAVILAQGFANHETAECRPGLAALMRAVCTSKRTLLRALAELQAAGWIECLGGNAPGRDASYRFRSPHQVPSVTPEQVPSVTPEQVPSVVRTGAIQCAPPIPPYKEQPNMNQNARVKTGGLTPRQLLRGKSRPAPQLSKLIAFDSHEAAEWDEYLAAKGFPPLERIGRKIGAGMLQGWDLPFNRPPRASADEVERAIALKFADWLRSIA